MVKTCSIYTCKSESYSGCDISFYRFPKNKALQQKWLSNIQFKQKITKNTVVCSRHFETSCFYMTNSRRLIKANAIPTISDVDSTTSYNGSEDNIKAEHSSELEIVIEQEPNEDWDFNIPMDSTTLCYDSEDSVKAEDSSIALEIVVKEEQNKDRDLNYIEENEESQAIPMVTQIFVKPDEESLQVNSNEIGDDFDRFTRNMAQQLRALPMDIALETQEMMWAILFEQRLKVNDVGDPLDKKNI